MNGKLNYTENDAVSENQLPGNRMRNKIRSTKDLRVNSVLRVYKKGFGYSKIHIIDNSDYYLAAGAEKEFIDEIGRAHV